jgi:homocysteine S-methyltransferase
MNRFESAVIEKGTVLAEGAVIERLSRRGELLDEHVLASSLVLKEEGRKALGEIFRSYIDVAAETNLPMIVLAPTWKAGAGQCERAGLDMKELNSACVRFIRETVSEYPGIEEKIFVGGLIGSRGDAYRPEEGLPRSESRRYHTPQIEALASAGVDFVMASTMPSFEEASGIADAASDTGAPLVMSWIVRNTGRVLDGTLLCEVVEDIDSQGGSPPLFHMANCVHPVNLARALGSDVNAPLAHAGRLIGLQGNASTLDPDELEGREELDADDPVRWAGAMAALRSEHGIRILGGCCGTDERYIRRLADFLMV